MTFDYVIWFPTWRCNNNCIYCWIKSVCNRSNWNTDAFKEPETSHHIWLEALNNFKCTILDINGGEPFIYHGIYEVIRNINCKIGITTNLGLMDVGLFSKSVEPCRVVSVTVSYHPGYINDNIVEKIINLHTLGYPVRINFVAYPDYIRYLDQASSLSQALEVDFNVEPYFNASTMKFHSYSQKELDTIFKYSVGQVRRRIFSSQYPKGTRSCTAESRPIVVPDGSIYPCMTRYLYDSGSKMGNIFKDNYTPMKEIVCNHECICAGDIDKTTQSALEG